MERTESVRIDAVTNVSKVEAHNMRTPEYMTHVVEDEDICIRPELSHFNEGKDLGLVGGSLSQHLQYLKDLYREKVGQMMQKHAKPIREVLFMITDETTMENLECLAREFEKLWGIHCLRIDIHRDEGKWEKGLWVSNMHAHMIFDFIRRDTGRVIKLSYMDYKMLLMRIESIQTKLGGGGEDGTTYLHIERDKFTDNQPQEKEVSDMSQDVREHREGEGNPSSLCRCAEKEKMKFEYERSMDMKNATETTSNFRMTPAIGDKSSVVYLLTNEAMPGLVRIGAAQSDDIRQLFDGLYTLDVPLPFEVAYAAKMQKEKSIQLINALHTAFALSRVNERREFFRLSSDQVVPILRLFDDLQDITQEVKAIMDEGLNPADRFALNQARGV